MYYEVNAGHGLPFDPFKAIVTPRPIGWITTVDTNGVPNLAPYSFFNAISGSPPMVMFSSEGIKDSCRNAKSCGEFVFSLATKSLSTAVNASSDTVPPEVNEYDLTDLTMTECTIVNPPRVKESPASLECKVVSVNELTDIHGQPVDAHMVIGQVLAVHIDDRYIVDGRFNTAGAQPLARCGYRDYSAVTSTFELMRPTDGATYDGVDR